MDPAQLRQLGRDVYAAINARDLDQVERLFAPDVVRHAMGQTGVDAALDAVRGLDAGVRFEVEDVFAEGDRVALRVSVQGREPSAGGRPATILEIFRVHEGRVAEIWGAGTGG